MADRQTHTVHTLQCAWHSIALHSVCLLTVLHTLVAAHNVLYHMFACTVDYVHRLCIVHVLYCLSWLQTVYCALPVFIVNVHEHYLH